VRTSPSESTQAAVHERNSLARRKWAELFLDAWQKQVPSIIEAGSILESAKAELRHGEWIAMIQSDLPISRSTANKLMKIAACDHLRNAEHVPYLPAHWGTLFELTLLTEEQFERGIKNGAINPKMQRKEVKALRGVTAITTESKPSSVAILKSRVAEQDIEIAQLKAQLANVHDGSLFDLKKDTPQNIADVVTSTVTQTKAIAISNAIKSAIKNKYQAAAPENAVHS
jgi:hypothetical protein